jgi:hypothetical protein
LRQRFEQYPPERRALLLLTRSIRQMETQNFVANGNPRPLLRIDPAQTLGKIEVARKLGSECIVGKPYLGIISG